MNTRNPMSAQLHSFIYAFAYRNDVLSNVFGCHLFSKYGRAAQNIIAASTIHPKNTTTAEQHIGARNTVIPDREQLKRRSTFARWAKNGRAQKLIPNYFADSHAIFAHPLCTNMLRPRQEALSFFVLSRLARRRP